MIRGRLAPTSRSQDYRTRLFDLRRDTDAAELEQLVERGAVREVHDTIGEQVAELVETRRADVRFTPSELEALAAELLGPEPDRYGMWVYFSWSGRLVHLLAEREFEELRTSRNRNKITRAEQTRLGRLRIGIVGLSVGHATAVTLALEGIGGVFRLADFDHLALSNLNRLRAGVHELGDHKAILTARRILELNPYARIELFVDGLSDDNIETFVGGDGNLDLVIEECDDLAMKVRVREVARQRGIPVLMETSDRGMLDIERFDREPDRPLFHGLAGALDSRALRGLTAYEKVPTVLAILGEISPRAGASLVDVESTLKTWPQLASAVALGSALNTDAARRIALGALHDSGRFAVDLEQLIADRTTMAACDPRTSAGDRTRVDTGPLSESELHTLVSWAAMAPSGGNAQPWRFVYRQRAGELDVWLARERATSSIDASHRGSLVALGAAVENARLAASELGRGVAIELCPSAEDLDLVATLRFTKTGVAVTEDPRDPRLRRHVVSRATVRTVRDEPELPRDVAAALCEIAEDGGGRLDLATDRAQRAALAGIVAPGDKLRLLNPRLHEELVAELRWTEDQVTSVRDGLDVRALDLTATELAVMRMLRSAEVSRALRATGGGDGLERGARKAITGCAAVGLLRRPGARTRRAYVEGGQVMQRLWLCAEAHGFGLHPMTGFLYWLEPAATFHDRIAHLEAIGAPFTAREQRELFTMRDAFLAHFPRMEAAEILLFRLIRKGAASERALRRPIESVLRIERES